MYRKAKLVFPYCYTMQLILLGEHDITKTEGTEQRFRVFKIISHDSYSHGKNYQHNIALIELQFHARFNANVQPICLPDFKKDVAAGTICYLTGKQDMC